MKKRILSVFLALMLTASLFPAAAAARVVVSGQSLRLDGKPVVCQKYNIDGRNYFMLRDLALLLNGTGSRFSVNWDGAKRCVSIVSGEEYIPDGSELDLSLGDQSASAAPSTQTIVVNGEERSDLTVYNIGGHNYFQLRELGAVLGFFVDYHKPSNTAIIISRVPCEPTPWLVREETELGAEEFGERSEQYRRSTYDPEGRLLTEVSGFRANDYEWANDWTYDELGRMVKEVRRSRNRTTGETGMDLGTTTREYDIWGNLVKETFSCGDQEPTVTEYLYDDQGRLVRVLQGDTVTENTWDERGRLLLEQKRSGEGKVLQSTRYEWDENGEPLLQETRDENGNVVSSRAWTRENGRTVKLTLTTGSRATETVYTYSDAGYLVLEESRSPEGETESTAYTRDVAGRVLREEWRRGEAYRITAYEYDGAGRLLREEYASSDDPYTAAAHHNAPYTLECRYDDEGNLIWKRLTEGGVNITETSITYDRAAGKQTTLVDHRTAPAERLVFREDTLTLEVGQVYYISYAFEPQGARTPLLTWTSSDPAAVRAEDFGKVTALAPGEAAVTASAEGLSASCRISVK